MQVRTEFTLEDGLRVIGGRTLLARVERHDGGYQSVTPGGRIVAAAPTIVKCLISVRSYFGGYWRCSCCGKPVDASDAGSNGRCRSCCGLDGNVESRHVAPASEALEGLPSW